MAQISVGAFDRVGLRLVPHHGVLSPVTDIAVSRESVREIMCSFGRTINQSLHDLRGALPDHLMRDDAARGTIYRRDDVGLRFFEPMKVNTSSSSTTSGAIMLGSPTGKL
jgi:hypothetical protein